MDDAAPHGPAPPGIPGMDLVEALDASVHEHAAFLRSVLDASSDCIKTLDLRGRLEYVNASGLCQLEVDDFERYRGLEWALLWPEPMQDRVRSAVAMARAGSIDRFEGFCPTTRGRARWWDVVVAPVPGADGRVARIVSVSRDVTSRSSTEATLRAFYEVSPLLMGTVELLPDGDILHLYDNPATSLFFGREPGSTTHATARALGVPETTIARWRSHYEDAARRGAPVSFEHTQPSLDGAGERTLAITVSALGSAGRVGVNTFCYVAQDVTGSRAAAAALQSADRRKDEFLATLSHELRNPLAPIRNAATLLDSPKLSAEGLAFARQVIQRQVTHMARLLDDLLDVARITQGKLDLRRETTTIGHVVEAALEAARPLIERKGHVLEVVLPSSPVTLEADPVRIAQVLTNLLTNAAKYTDAGGRITLTASLERSGVLLAVRDTGIGLTPQALATVFTMFNQIPCERDRSEGGLGIGLALVRAVVELHGGTLRAQSDGPGSGSEFRVWLPGPCRSAARDGEAPHAVRDASVRA
jgi:PAS domain S-box-containing protein